VVEVEVEVVAVIEVAETDGMVATQVEGGYGRHIRKIIVLVRPYCMRVVLAVEPRGSSLRHLPDATVLV
jgi:hypothetical protein